MKQIRSWKGSSLRLQVDVRSSRSPRTLERVEQIGRLLRARPPSLAMLSPREASRPGRLVDAVRVVADLIREPGRVEEVRQEHVGAILMVIAGLETALATRLMAAEREGVVNSPAEPEADRLLTAQEAAKVLGVSADYLYRHARALPFAVRPTPGTLRFSAQGIARTSVENEPNWPGTRLVLECTRILHYSSGSMFRADCRRARQPAL